MFPLDPNFNRVVLSITDELLPQGFDVTDRAPDNYCELKAEFTRRGRIVVFAGASELTIYADTAVNYAFRAWHDLCHLQGNYDTSYVGEVATCGLQTRQMLKRFGHSELTWKWTQIIEAEIIGQAGYFERYRRFPIDQAAFVVAYLKSPFDALDQQY